MVYGGERPRVRTCYDRSAPSQPRRVHGGGPPLTGEDSGRPLHLDAHPREFGSFQLRASFGDGRFGPVFLADDPETGRRVVIRTFTQPFTDEQRDALMAALRDLCELPLDHPSVARPMGCGLDGDTPYFVHSFLEGIPADDYLAANGPSRLADLMPLLTPAAAAIDFSSAAGVTHGALGLRDVIISTKAAGVSGFGLVQALQSAGVDIGNVARDPAGDVSHAADIRALGTITSALLIRKDASRIRHLVDNPPQTALEFVAALQGVLAGEAITLAEEAITEVPPSTPIVKEPELRLREAPDVVHPALFAAPGDLSPETHRRSVRRWVPLAVAASLAVGLVAGFAGGVVFGRREVQSAPPPKTAAPPRPTATAGQIFTDQGVARQPAPETESPKAETPFPVPSSPVPRSPVPSSPVPSSPVPGSRVPGSETRNRTPNEERQTRTNPNPEPGTRNRELPPSLWVESRPMGASVYVDNQLVGRTPLLLGGITAGGHTVRLEMTGYHQWMTKVTVAENGRTRVAASLEQ